MKHRCLILLLIVGCTSNIKHPVTEDSISIPRNYEDKIDFDLTLLYEFDTTIQSKDNISKLISSFETSGLFIEVQSLNPLLGSFFSDLEVAANGRAKSSVRVIIKELKNEEITFTLMPSYQRGGFTQSFIQKLSDLTNFNISSFSNGRQRWIIKESKDELINKLNKIMTPLGFVYVN